MASYALSPAIAPSQLCSGKNGMNASSSRAALAKCVRNGKDMRMKVRCMATSIPADRVPDMGKRELMNLLLLGALALPTGGMLLPYTYFFVPPGENRELTRMISAPTFPTHRFLTVKMKLLFIIT